MKNHCPRLLVLLVGPPVSIIRIPWELLELQTLGPYSRLTESDILEDGAVQPMLRQALQIILMHAK